MTQSLLSRRNLLLGGALVTATGAYAAMHPSKLLPVLNWADALAPGDAAVTRLAAGLAYGADPRQKLDIYAPAQRKGPLPVLMFYYGGGWNSGARANYAFAGRAFAARGFVVVVPDYRLVPQVVFPGFVEDSAAALHWALANIAEHGGDPARLAVAGHSAGAYNAAMLALDPRWGVSGQIKALVGLAGPYDFYPFDTDSSRNAFGAAPEPALTQPIHFARAGAPPSLLLAGDADTTVRPRNAQHLAAALSAAGSSATLKLYPGVGHSGIVMALARPFRRIAPVLEDAAAFLARV